MTLSDGQGHRGDCLHLERSLTNKLIRVRERDHGSPDPPSPFPPGKDDCRSRDPGRGRSPRHPWTTSSRPPGARPVTEEILPGTSVTISGCERGEEESPGRGCDTCPARRIAPRNLLQLTASTSNVPTDYPPLATETRPHQEDFFPAPFRVPPERPEPPEASGKGRITFVTPLLPTTLGRGRGGVSQSLLLQLWNHR